MIAIVEERVTPLQSVIKPYSFTPRQLKIIAIAIFFCDNER